MEYKTQSIRKKFTHSSHCLCDVYLEYPQIFSNNGEKKAISTFYRTFAENALECAKNASRDMQSKSFTLFLRMHFDIEATSPKNIKVSLHITRRDGMQTIFKKTLVQIWDISTEKLIME